MPWEANEDEAPWSDREAWRGGLHADDGEAWHGGQANTREYWIDDGEDGDLEVEIEIVEIDDEWPEDLAGPEYWLFKRDGM